MKRLCLSFAVLALLAMPGVARADCDGKTGIEGGIVYDSAGNASSVCADGSGKVPVDRLDTLKPVDLTGKRISLKGIKDIPAPMPCRSPFCAHEDSSAVKGR